MQKGIKGNDSFYLYKALYKAALKNVYYNKLA